MANIKEIIGEKTSMELEIDNRKAIDKISREGFLKTLPKTVANLTKTLIDEMTDEEFRSCYTRSGSDWVQYEIRCKMEAGKIENNKEVRYDFNDEPYHQDPIERWMIALLQHDVNHIKNLYHPLYCGSGIDVYLREGLFNTDTLGEINREFTMAIQNVIQTTNHVRLLVGTDWGSCTAILTLTFPKKASN